MKKYLFAACLFALATLSYSQQKTALFNTPASKTEVKLETAIDASIFEEVKLLSFQEDLTASKNTIAAVRLSDVSRKESIAYKKELFFEEKDDRGEVEIWKYSGQEIMLA